MIENLNKFQINEKARKDTDLSTIIDKLGLAGMLLPMLSSKRFLDYADSPSLRVRNTFYLLGAWDFIKSVVYIGMTYRVAEALGHLSVKYF